jgi:putative DNA primase/helicase
MAEHIGDESAYLRLTELMAGKIQFTDGTNAARLVADFGRDIRYNGAWKKWLVWNGKY